MRITFLSIIALLSFGHASAQDSLKKTASGKPRMKMSSDYIYILPDGTQIPLSKIDSVDKAWGGKGILFSHKNDPLDKRMFLLPNADDFATKQKLQHDELLSTVNQPAPGFSLNDVSRNRYTLAHMKGKIVVLNFYFRACAPCIAEMPDLNKVVKDNKSDGIVFLALALDKIPEIKSFLKANRFDFISLPNAKSVHSLYKVNVCPTTIVIDKQGVIRYISRDSKTIGKFLNEAIAALSKAKQ